MPRCEALVLVEVQTAFEGPVVGCETNTFAGSLVAALRERLADLPSVRPYALQLHENSNSVGLSSASHIGRSLIPLNRIDQGPLSSATAPVGVHSEEGHGQFGDLLHPVALDPGGQGSGRDSQEDARPMLPHCQVVIAGIQPACMQLNRPSTILRLSLELHLSGYHADLSRQESELSIGRRLGPEPMQTDTVSASVVVRVVVAAPGTAPIAESEHAVPISGVSVHSGPVQVELEMPVALNISQPAIWRVVVIAAPMSVAEACLPVLPQPAADEVLRLLNDMAEECRGGQVPSSIAEAMQDGVEMELHAAYRTAWSQPFQDFCRDMRTCLAGREPAGLLDFLRAQHLDSTLALCAIRVLPPSGPPGMGALERTAPAGAMRLGAAAAPQPEREIAERPSSEIAVSPLAAPPCSGLPAPVPQRVQTLSGALLNEPQLLQWVAVEQSSVVELQAPPAVLPASPSPPTDAAVGPLLGHLPPPRLTLSCVLVGFPHSRIERDYVRHKHAAGAAFDYYGACFALLYFLAFVIRLLREGDLAGNIGFAMYAFTRVLPFVPLVVSRRWFSAHREALMAASEAASAALVALKLLWPGVAPTPTARMETFWRFHLELIVYGLVKPVCQHTRFPVFALVMLAAWLTVTAAFTLLRTLAQAALHFAPGCFLGLLLGLYFEFRCRRAYVRYCEEVQRVTAAKNAAADTSAAGRAGSDDDGAAWEGGPGTSSSAAAPAKHKAE